MVAVLVLARDGEVGPVPESRTPGNGGNSATASAKPGSTSTHDAHEIGLDAPPTLSRPAKVPVSGSYPAAAPGTSLRVQLLDADGRWVSFPLPTAVDESGRFATFVELARRGTSRLRVVDPASSATSNVVTVEVR
ncbi:MAG: hypothetical protein ACRDQ0_23580 [Pseudonocardia sp.]